VRVFVVGERVDRREVGPGEGDGVGDDGYGHLKALPWLPRVRSE
jgi:hypothetical protein